MAEPSFDASDDDQGDLASEEFDRLLQAALGRGVDADRGHVRIDRLRSLLDAVHRASREPLDPIPSELRASVSAYLRAHAANKFGVHAAAHEHLRRWLAHARRIELELRPAAESGRAGAPLRIARFAALRSDDVDAAHVELECSAVEGRVRLVGRVLRAPAIAVHAVLLDARTDLVVASAPVGHDASFGLAGEVGRCSLYIELDPEPAVLVVEGLGFDG
jgi:hypothetical protein